MIRTIRLPAAAMAVGMAASILLLAGAARAADPVFPTGQRVGLVPPPGLTPSERFPGFEDRSTGTVVRFIETGQPIAESAKLIGRGELRQQGIVEDKRESFPPPRGKGTLVAGRQKADGIAARTFILLAPSEPASVLVVTQIPDAAKATYPDDAVRTMLASVTTRASVPIEEQLSLLPIRFDDLAGMRPFRVLGSSGALLTDGPKDTLEAAEQPLMFVTVGRGGPDEAAARETFARNLFVGLGGYKDVHILWSEMLRLGGGTANTHQVMAEAKDAKTDAPLKLVQWIRFGAGAYVRMVGVARDDAWSDALRRFRAVRDGIGPRG